MGDFSQQMIVKQGERGSGAHVRAALKDKASFLDAIAKRLSKRLETERVFVAVGVDLDPTHPEKYYVGELESVYQAAQQRRMGSGRSYWTITKGSWCVQLKWLERTFDLVCDG